MNENIDLTKILEGCPEGTKLYSSIYGDVLFLRKTYFNQIVVCNTNGTDFHIRKDGKIYDYKGAECTIFPSRELRDWSKFERFWDKPKVDKFDPHTFQPFVKVLCRDFKYEPWKAQIFSNRMDGCEFNYQCIGTSFKYCIPYNDETKQLVGTTDDCPEYYKWWEE